MTLAWIAAKIDRRLIKTFCTAGWEIKTFALAEFMTHNLLSTEMEVLVIEVVDRPSLETCQQICSRRLAPVVAVVMDLAYAQAALEGGADDFLLAPVEPIEALLRVRKLARRANIVRVGDLEIDLLAWNVSYLGQHVHLSTVEFRLLASLAKRVGQMVNHATILKDVWALDAHPKTLAQVKSYVGRVRRKIEPDLQNPQYIISIPGAGYRLRDQRQWEARLREAGKPSGCFMPRHDLLKIKS